MAGNLNFICQALPAGRVFLCSLYRLTRGALGQKAKAGHHCRICRETYDDLTMFADFLNERAAQHTKSIPFLNKLQVFNSDLQLFADSVGSADLGFGCFFQGDWRKGLWKHTGLFSNHYKPNIALLELYAIVMDMEVWAERVAGKSIILRSDNMATVAFINKMWGDIPAAMSLLRTLTKTCLHFQIFLKAVHIKGTLNQESDWISCNQMANFFSKQPLAPRKVPKLPTPLWPPQWSREEMEKYPRINHSSGTTAQQK